jgi:hypothetical protein
MNKYRNQIAKKGLFSPISPKRNTGIVERVESNNLPKTRVGIERFIRSEVDKAIINQEYSNNISHDYLKSVYEKTKYGKIEAHQEIIKIHYLILERIIIEIRGYEYSSRHSCKFLGDDIASSRAVKIFDNLTEYVNDNCHIALDPFILANIYLASCQGYSLSLESPVGFVLRKIGCLSLFSMFLFTYSLFRYICSLNS